jgi:hypothetical protein
LLKSLSDLATQLRDLARRLANLDNRRVKF